MKRTGTAVAASMALASSAAAFASHSDPMPNYVSDPKSKSGGQGGRKGEDDGDDRRRSEQTDRFSPRFDGLRFIETLVAAHR